MWEIIADALLDSIKLFPFMLLIYILMELIESAKNKEKIEKALSSSWAPVVAGAVGVVPECGFAVMCSKLYDRGLVKTGTLISAFLAVSDEGLIVLIPAVVTNQISVTKVVLLLGIKIIYAIIVGEILNILLKNFDTAHICPEKDDCIECGEHHSKPVDKFFIHPLVHALKVFAYVLILNIILGFILHYIEGGLNTFIDNSEYYQPLLTALVGLIPNCASSVLLSSAYINGVLTFSGLIAGLSANAGIGFIILFKNGKNFKKNLFIVMLMYVCAIILGYIIMPFSI